MKIWLIRHGKTEANEKHWYCGKTDLPLSCAGKEALLTYHYEINHVRFLTSGMKRTNETLQLLFGPVPFEENSGFQEMNFGAFEMRGYEELKENPDYQRWITGDNEANVTPGGESGEQMRNRVIQAFQAVLEEQRDTVIVTHGGVIAAIMEWLFPEEHKNRYEWQPSPGRGYVLSGEADTETFGWEFLQPISEF